MAYLWHKRLHFVTDMTPQFSMIVESNTAQMSFQGWGLIKMNTLQKAALLLDHN